MKRNLHFLFTAVVASVILASGSCFAGVITLSRDDIITTTYTPGQSNPKADDIVAYLQGSDDPVSDIGDLLFKWERENNSEDEESDLSSSYDVVGLQSNGELGGTIDYISGDIVDASNGAWLVVKGGQTGFVVYDLASLGVPDDPYSWNGIDDLVFTNAGLVNNGGKPQAISNLQIWGFSGPPPNPVPGPSPSPVVPEPTTLAIWSALGVCGLAVRRKRSKK
jgi:hypothetical protein